MTEIDTLARRADAVSGTWTQGNVTVQRDRQNPHSRADPLSVVVMDGHVLVEHSFMPEDLSDNLVARVTAQITSAGLAQQDFELVMVGLVRSTIDNPLQAWTRFYRNSLDQLLDGSADFAPIHERAQSLVAGSVLDLGSCFGFFPLRLALSGTTVTATDLSEGTMRLLSSVAPELGATLTTLVCNGADVPRADKSVDTVTALHLLEHVDPATGSAIISEAIRVARRRVVLAVPYEDEATPCHGHIRTFDSDVLSAIGSELDCAFEVSEFHGGWLVLDLER